MNEEIVNRCRVQIPGTEAYRNELEPALVGIVSAFIDEGWRMDRVLDPESHKCITFWRGRYDEEYAVLRLRVFRYDAPKYGKPSMILNVSLRTSKPGSSIGTVLEAGVSYDQDEHPADIYDAVADNLVPAMERMIHAIRGTCEYLDPTEYDHATVIDRT